MIYAGWIVAAVLLVLLLCMAFAGRAIVLEYAAEINRSEARHEQELATVRAVKMRLADSLKARETLYDVQKDTLDEMSERLRAWQALGQQLSTVLATAPFKTCGADALDGMESDCERGWTDAVTALQEQVDKIQRKH